VFSPGLQLQSLISDSQYTSFAGHNWLRSKIYCYVRTGKNKAKIFCRGENGQEKFCYHLYKGKIHGAGVVWFNEGAIRLEENFSYGRLHGLNREWYESGKLKRRVNYKNGHKTGIMREYYENGRFKSYGKYTMGIPQGKHLFFSESGRVTTEKIYINGVLIPKGVNELMASGQLKAHHILRIGNAEVRRICLEALTYEKFLMQMKHEIITRENDSELVRIDWHKNEEPIYLVKVKCPSSGVFYTLRVPPDMKTVKEAIAWTFNVESAEYLPLEET